MELSDLIKKYTPIGEKYGSINEIFMDTGMYQKKIEIDDIKLIYSSYRDGSNELQVIYEDFKNKDIASETKKELIKDLAIYFLNH